MSIYLLLQYEKLRPVNSFINRIIEYHAEKECLKLALDVLNSDIDGKNFIDNSYIFNNTNMNINIIDDLNIKNINIIKND